MKDVNKEPSKREILLKSYKSARRVLMEVCEDCGIEFEKTFPSFIEQIDDSVSDETLHLKTQFMKNQITELISKNFLENWLEVIDKSYDDEQKNYIIQLVNKSVKSDPIHIYRCCSTACNSLAQLGNNTKKNTELKHLEDYSSYSTIEDVENNYGILLYSKYKEEASKAFVKGFKKNNQVNYTFATALFGECEEQVQPGQQ